MSDERRGAPRVRGVFDGTWSGASGNSSARFSDLSVSGCYVDSLATPAQGERVHVQLHLPQGPLSVEAEVIYVEPHKGFGLHFVDLAPAASAMLAEAVARVSGTAGRE